MDAIDAGTDLVPSTCGQKPKLQAAQNGDLPRSHLEKHIDCAAIDM